MVSTTLSSPRPGSLGAWLLASRPATLSAAAVPVVVGSACAHALGGFAPGPALAALGGAWLLQIAANLANDVFDYEQGADTSDRLGPTRAAAAGLLSPRELRLGLGVVLALALAVGVYLTSVAGPSIVVIGLASMLAAVAYTAGPYPLGYHGLGDVFVLLFFGFVAVCGTVFVQLGRVPPLAVAAALPVGTLATAMLVVNNLRDRDTDARAGKRTLAVRLGERGSVVEYGLLLAAAYATPAALVVTGSLGAWALLPGLTLPSAASLLRGVARERGRALNPRLAQTARLLGSFGLTFALAIALDGSFR